MSDRELDPYSVLNVTRSATQSEIRAAYQILVTKYHPDLHQGNPLEDLAGARLVEVNRAYEILSDPIRRAAYCAESGAQHRPVAAASLTSKRLIWGVAFLLAVQLVARTGAYVIRGLLGLARDLLELTASFPGGRLAVIALLALAILAVTLLRRRRS